MPLSEFELIRTYFSGLTGTRDDVALGIGDDCALLTVPAGKTLAVSTDTLVENRHFRAGVDAADLGHKALAVNLSDLAAMGAEPAWVTLALTLPEADAQWLRRFAQGFSELAAEYRVALVGGDTTRGPLAMTIQVHGFVDSDRALRRDAARPGDLLYVTGTLGDAGLALLVEQGLYTRPEYLEFLRSRLARPRPRVEAGQAMRGLATSAIDVSDGLSSDLGHVLEASGCGATLQLGQLPMSPAVREYVSETGDWNLPLAGGDDYELCLAIPQERQGDAEAIGKGLECGLAWIGSVEATPGLRCATESGELVDGASGYDHFGGDD